MELPDGSFSVFNHLHWGSFGLRSVALIGRSLRRRRFLVLASAAGAAVFQMSVAADDGENFTLHGQFTYVEQETGDFNNPYAGRNSLSSNRGAETIDAGLDIGARLWSGAEGWIDPEIDQGFGLDDTLGVAGFPSGEAYKVGKNQPYLRLPRLFLRQTLDLAGARQTVDPLANQLGGYRSENRVVVTVGKFSVADIFDTNQYAHDPRVDFLNWSAIDTGTFDYAADAWGYTVGAALTGGDGNRHWRLGRPVNPGGLFAVRLLHGKRPCAEPGYPERVAPGALLGQLHLGIPERDRVRQLVRPQRREGHWVHHGEPVRVHGRGRVQRRGAEAHGVLGLLPHLHR